MMDINNKSIVYMGTPDFAVPSLTALHQTGFDIRLVMTQPDKPKGRGRKMTAPPVKTTALDIGLEVYQPETVRSPDVIERLRSINPDFIVVVAYGQILPKEVLQIPALGAINLHGSLLPKYRGPAPIQWAIIRGETETGLTTMLMDQGVDTGDILISRPHPILPTDTCETLHDSMAVAGAGLLVETLQQRSRGRIFPVSQNNAQATFAPMLRKQDGKIDWNSPAKKLNAFIRAMTPWPGAFCFLDDKRIKLYGSTVIDKRTDALPGTVVPGFPDELHVATEDGILSIEKIQGASGKILLIKDYLCGHPVEPGTVFK